MGSESKSAPLILTPRSEPEQGQQTASFHNSGSFPRSCYNCHRKKIRCNKEDPCSACVRAGKPCGYPPLGPRTRRTKKTIMADMVSRIASLEKSLAEAREAKSNPTPFSSESTNPAISVPQATTYRPEKVIQRSGEDIVVQMGSSSQYFNEVILSKVIQDVSFTDAINSHNLLS